MDKGASFPRASQSTIQLLSGESYLLSSTKSPSSRVPAQSDRKGAGGGGGTKAGCLAPAGTAAVLKCQLILKSTGSLLRAPDFAWFQRHPVNQRHTAPLFPHLCPSSPLGPVLPTLNLEFSMPISRSFSQLLALDLQSFIRGTSSDSHYEIIKRFRTWH